MYNSNISTKDENQNMARKSRYIENNKLILKAQKVIKAGIYARISEADGDDDTSESIKN